MTSSRPKQDSDSHSRLLDEIEAFSRNGPPAQEEGPAKPVLTRDKLSFPDLNQPPAERRKPMASTASSPASPANPARTLPAGGTSSLLARLREQARSVQRTVDKHDAEAEMRAFRLSASLGSAFHYLNDLVKQVNIIKPEIPKAYELPGNIIFTGMRWDEGAADFRMLPTASEDRLYETVTVRFRMSAPRQIQVERDALNVEPLRKQLHDANIAYQLEERKNKRSQLESGMFTLPCEIRAGFLLKADYEANRLVLRTRNLERFGMMEFHLEANDLAQGTLDALAQLMLAEDNRFLKLFRRSA